MNKQTVVKASCEVLAETTTHTCSPWHSAGRNKQFPFIFPQDISQSYRRSRVSDRIHLLIPDVQCSAEGVVLHSSDLKQKYSRTLHMPAASWFGPLQRIPPALHFPLIWVKHWAV